MVRLNVVLSKQDETPAFAFELKLGLGDGRSWLKSSRFPASLLALQRELAGGWICWVGATPHELLCFRSCCQDLSFQGGEKPKAAAGAQEEPLLQGLGGFK